MFEENNNEQVSHPAPDQWFRFRWQRSAVSDPEPAVQVAPRQDRRRHPGEQPLDGTGRHPAHGHPRFAWPDAEGHQRRARGHGRPVGHQGRLTGERSTAGVEPCKLLTTCLARAGRFSFYM